MEFRVLGPLEVRHEGRTLPLTRGKPRSLLAVLLLHANEIVSTDRLVEALWSAPPESARTALQVYVVQLRKVLEPGRPRGAPPRLLLTRAPGYLLRLDPDQLDVRRFERGLEHARSARSQGPAAAAAVLRDALSLWRGSALADFVYQPFAQAEIARLEELRVGALEDRIDADLELGAGASLIGELETLVRAHPLRERLRRHLMLALYRADRQAEALQAYDDARHTLADQLGIVPGPALRRLHDRILQQDAELERRAPAPAPAGPPRPPADVRTTRATVTALVAGRAPPPDADPEAVAPGVDEDAAGTAIDRHGGRLAGVLGDRVAGVFGIPHLHEDDALRAARAAVELLGPTSSVGVATGEIVTTDPASGAILAAEPVTSAAALQHRATAGQVILDDRSHRLLGPAVRAEPLEVDGHVLWRLAGLVPPAPPLSRPPDRPLIGRDHELAQLVQALERTARERTVHLFTILGDAGIGKSRLAEELASRVSGEATVVAGRCVPYGEGITFWPLREVVATLTAATPLSELMAGEEDAAVVTARVSEAVRGHDAASSLEEIFWAFRRLLETLARTRPLVLVIEDIHWAEPSLLDFVDAVAERGRASPILLLCIARPELLEHRPGWGGGKRNASTLELERLSAPESERLVDAIGGALPARVRARVLETAEGNPLFLEQIVAMLAEERSPEGPLAIPPTIQAVLAARLDRLGPAERMVLACAAVAGREFSDAVVSELLPEGARPYASRHLDTLVDRDLLLPASERHGHGARRFRHALIQQTAYRMIAKRERATLHERAGTWLVKRPGSDASTAAERAGYHLEQAFRYRSELDPPGDRARELARRAAGLLASAGRAAFRRGDMPAAANLLQRASSLYASEDDALALLPELGYAQFEIGELAQASRTLSETAERARAGGDRGVEWHASVELAHARMYTDPETIDLDALARTAAGAIEALGPRGDAAGLARAWSLLVDVAWARGTMAEAAHAAERAAVHAGRARSPREEAWALGACAFAQLLGPTPAPEGVRTTERLLDQAAGNLVLEANLSGFLAALEAMTGRFDQARVHITESRQRLGDLGLTWQVAVQDLLAGYIELLAGEPAGAEQHIRASCDAFASIGDRWFLATAAVDLARSVDEQGRHADARDAVAAIPDVPAGADREWEIKRHGIHARLLAQEGRIGEGLRHARAGVAAAEGTDLVWFHADALTDLAFVLTLGGRRREAEHAARAALALHQRKGNVASAGRVLGLQVTVERRPTPPRPRA
jgi:DNA-binding SARP family transcriptional activator